MLRSGAFPLLGQLFTLCLPLVMGAASYGHSGGIAQPSSCQSAAQSWQKQEFYEGLAVLAESNLEKFFIPHHRSALHAQLLAEGERLSYPQSIWWIAEGQDVVFTAERPAVSPTEEEMDQVLEFRQMNTADMTEEQLSHQLSLEKKLHRALYQVHQESLESYRNWAFEAFPPLRAYQRIFENYVSSSVWWNTYVSEYAHTLAKIYHEQQVRQGCPPEVLWTATKSYKTY